MMLSDADLPRLLQPQLILLVPKLVHDSEHTIAAGLLLNLLAGASQINREYERELRLPVLSALSLLQIRQDAAVSVFEVSPEVNVQYFGKTSYHCKCTSGISHDSANIARSNMQFFGLHRAPGPLSLIA